MSGDESKVNYQAQTRTNDPVLCLVPPRVVWGVFLIEQASKNNPESQAAAQRRHMEAIKTVGKSPATTRTKAARTSRQA